MKKTVIQGDMTSGGQRRWEIHSIDDEDVKAMLENIKTEAHGDLRKFCQDRAVELLSGNIILDGKLFHCDYQPTLDILKFLIELTNAS